MAKRKFLGYATYNFVDKDPVIDELRTIIQDEKAGYKEISDTSGVSTQTLYNWFSGDTKRPQHATIMAVARSLGYDYKLVKTGKVVVLKKLVKKKAA